MLNTPLEVINRALSMGLIFHEGAAVCQWANWRTSHFRFLFETLILNCPLCGLLCAWVCIAWFTSRIELQSAAFQPFCYSRLYPYMICYLFGYNNILTQNNLLNFCFERRLSQNLFLFCSRSPTGKNITREWLLISLFDLFVLCTSWQKRGS